VLKKAEEWRIRVLELKWEMEMEEAAHPEQAR
jgi:hypothetical protein